MTPDDLRARYDAIRDEAAPLVRSGAAVLDAHVLDRGGDRRRGVTLHVRPDEATVARIVEATAPLRAREPGQGWQAPEDLHLTVETPLPATADFPRYLGHMGTYQAAVEEALEEAQPFDVALRGLVLARDALLLAGWPEDDTLDRLRERVRAALVARGRGAELDGRYRRETAHVTLMRFARPLADAAGFVDAVAALRDVDLGVLHVDRLELVLGDWYGTASRSTPIEGYLLGA